MSGHLTSFKSGTIEVDGMVFFERIPNGLDSKKNPFHFAHDRWIQDFLNETLQLGINEKEKKNIP